MNIIADENMPGVEDLFGAYGDIKRIAGRTMSAIDVAGADLLLVRSVTSVNGELLDNTAVQFVGSATIGTDHVDTDYLSKRGIGFAHAPGCNADAVVQYDLSVFCRLMPNWRELRVGIVGCGNVGGRLYNMLRGLGVECQIYDPFLTAYKNLDMVDFGEVLKANIVCLHTPLTRSGSHPTEHLFGRAQLDQLAPGTLLLNAGRGAVIDNQALDARLSESGDLKVALDVWETEPRVDKSLLQRVDIATPHIAGHSVEGKLRGTQMIFDQFLAWSGALPHRQKAPVGKAAELALKVTNNPLNSAILACYDVAVDDLNFRHAINKSNDTAYVFDQFRKNYPFRHEFSYYRCPDVGCAADCLGILGFAV